MKEWNKNITIPNLLSVLRILLILPFVYFFMTGNVLLAGLMLFRRLLSSTDPAD